MMPLDRILDVAGSLVGVLIGGLSAFFHRLKEHWVEALINFSATFAGVFFSFWVERWRSTKQEKDDFGKVLQGLAFENATNLALLPGLKECSVNMIPGFSLSNQLRLAVANPLFHRWAKHSLVLAAMTVSTHMELLNNLLARLRAANVDQISEHAIEELKDGAKRGQELIRVWQDLINEELPKFGGHPQADAKTNETREKLRRAIMRS
jgi:hypothetical protein